MNRLYYLDTSIWLDLFENRNEPTLPKGDWSWELVSKIIKENDKIICSEVVKNEMVVLGYSRYEIDKLFSPFLEIIKFVYSNKKQFSKAKDLSRKRKIPLFDALHALVARDCGAIMVTRDRHFNKLGDIVRSKKPEEII